MNYRTLGSSELQVSQISLGSWLTYAGGVGLAQTRACTDAAFEADAAAQCAVPSHRFATPGPPQVVIRSRVAG